jgi:hypothetical protein
MNAAASDSQGGLRPNANREMVGLIRQRGDNRFSLGITGLSTKDNRVRQADLVNSLGTIAPNDDNLPRFVLAQRLKLLPNFLRRFTRTQKYRLTEAGRVNPRHASRIPGLGGKKGPRDENEYNCEAVAQV